MNHGRALAAVAVCLGLALAAPPSIVAAVTIPRSSVPMAVSNCSDVLFVGARGSGQTSKDAGGFGKEVDKVRSVLVSELPGLEVHAQAVQYASESVNVLWPGARTAALLAAGPATSALAIYDYKQSNLNPYMASIQDGVDEILKILRSRKQCASERIVIAGYSQGAIAAHRAVQRLHSAGETGILNRIDGMELVADGDRVQGSASTVVGAPAASAKGNGISVYFKQQNKEIPGRLVALTIHVCDHADIVCDFSPTNIKVGRSIHTSYTSRGQISDAAQQIAKQVKRPPAATGVGQGGPFSWVQEDTTPDGQVFSRRVGTMSVSSSTFKAGQTVNITYTEDEYGPDNPQFGTVSPCAFPGALSVSPPDSYKTLYVVPSARTREHPSNLPYGYLSLASRMTESCAVVDGREARRTSYAGPATFNFSPWVSQTPITNVPVGFWWTGVTGCGCNGVATDLTLVMRPIRGGLTTSR